MNLFASKKHVDDEARHLLVNEIELLEDEVGRYERIFKGSRGYGFVDWDLSCEVMLWHGGFWQSLGYTEDDMAAISDPTRFLQFMHDEDRDVLNTNIYRILHGEKIPEFTLRAKKKDEGYIWVSSRVEIEWGDDGRAKFVSGILFDISKLKLAERALLHSEARYQRIIQSSRDGIWEWNADKGGFHFSSRCWALLGFDESDDEISKGHDRWKIWRARMHLDDLEQYDKTVKEQLKNRTPFDVEYRAQAKDGGWRWIRARGQAEFDETGFAIRMSGTNMDITKLKVAQARVLRAKEEAEKASQAKSEFLSSMSHELRTPLNAILGFANLLATDSTLTDEQRGSMSEIIRAGNHLLQLVDDVLDLAKIEAGRMNVCMNFLSPADIMRECVELIKPEAEARAISIDCQLNGNRNTLVEADDMRMKQVLLNLLSNAIKYNRKNGYVRIAFNILAEGRLRICIADSGKGIAEEDRENIFKPFNRLGEEGSNIEGAGIGLVITKVLVETMRGTIDFSSQLGRGTEFRLEFPCKKGSDMPEPRIEVKSKIVSEKLPELFFDKPITVLYIEDNPTNQRLLQQMLARYEEFSLDIAVEPIEGVYRARTEKPDLVLLDIDLPGLSGYEVVKILKQDPQTQHIPVIALSAKAMAHDIQKGMESGFDEYLTKPFNLEKFIGLCNELFVHA